MLNGRSPHRSGLSDTSGTNFRSAGRVTELHAGDAQAHWNSFGERPDVTQRLVHVACGSADAQPALACGDVVSLRHGRTAAR
ncbi:hypothetical protein BRAO375_4300026 [Bradyrhizobium sp. ORS 375]|nr:hypothetical protein BRAO375_4300026 [Bradyrhizobium sp. ORS 375]